MKRLPPAVLLNNYTMQIEEPTEKCDSSKIVVQGISLTGILSIRASQASALRCLLYRTGLGERLAHSNGVSLEKIRCMSDRELAELSCESWLEQYWGDFATDATGATREFAVNVDLPSNYWYGHLRVYDAVHDDPELRSQIIATYILAHLTDRRGYARMLQGLDQTVLLLDNGQITPGDPVGVNIPNYGMTFSYSSSGQSVDEGCDVIRGPFIPAPGPTPTSGTATIINTTVKEYKPVPPPVPPAPPTPPTKPDSD